ncbi:MAG TPA: 6-carboxytetrahydropterin synthase [Rhodothermales bacterium]|nr:6-carboxytetrahydropterin synthase [Rhodothermales bacterium]
MPTVYVTRRAHFNAAHRLHNPAMPDAWNQETFGKCNLPNWHGHNYVLEVTVAGEPSPDTGFVIDLAYLRDLIKTHIEDEVDHRNLNLDVPWLAGVLPSTENLCIAFWQRLAPHIPAPARLHRIRLHETERNLADYYGD